MEKHEALDLLAELDGDEHEWVDFKQDYHIGGIRPKKAEFIRDIASLANSISSRDERYIFIGVDDGGEIIGVKSDSKKKHQKRPRYIFSYDESDIQEIADSNLEPCPNFSFHRYRHDGTEFGALVIYPVQQAPCVTIQDINDSDGNRILHHSLVYIRKGSRKKVAGHEEIEDIIQNRIEKRREDILKNVGKIVSLGPDTIDQLGTQVTDDGIAVTPTEDSGLEVQERLTRDPASTLDKELNGDIANWASRGDLLNQKAIWKYYANPNKIELDYEAAHFLTLCSIDNKVRGIFWLQDTGRDEIREILLDTPDSHHRIIRVASVFVLMGDEDGLEILLDKTSSTAEFGELQTYKNLVSQPINERMDRIIESYSYEIEYQDWSTKFDIRDMDVEEILNQISNIADVLVSIYEDVDDNRHLLWKARETRDAIGDLEIGLAATFFSPVSE